MGYSLVKIAPVTVNAALAAGDVLFDSTEFKLPARTCKLVSAVIVDYNNKLLADDVALVFHQDNAGGTWGTGGDAEALSSANAVLNLPIAVVPVHNEGYGACANFTISSSAGFESTDHSLQSNPVILQRDTRDDKIYIMGRVTAVSTGGTIAGTNDDEDELVIYLGFEW